LVLIYLLKPGGAGFLGPDEPRYASIGREMARDGDWVTPRLNGSPWFEKPPLLYWTTAAANRLGLRDEWAARVPMALISLTFLLFFHEILRREFSSRLALAATAILGGSAGWLVASFAAVPDLPMSAAFAAAMMIALFDNRADPEKPPKRRLRRAWAAGALLGIAILAKGFVPVALFAPVWWIAREKRLRILAAAAIVAAPWYLLCWTRNGSAFWNDFFWKQHVQRLISAQALQHGQPFWYYVPVILVGLFPWTPLAALIGLKKARARGWMEEDARVRFLLLWALGALIFFSIVPNKLPFYVLPLMPALAVVMAAALEAVRGREWWLAACVGSLILLPSIAGTFPEAYLEGATRAHWYFDPRGLIAVVAAAGIWWLSRHGRWTAAMLASSAIVAAGGAYLKLTTLAPLDQRDSARAFWRAHQGEIGEACVAADVPRAWVYGLSYYASRAVPDCGASVAESWEIRGRNGTLQIERR
jgi:4-amino-4-deoxy-L-arabinose transferase-like glycosyltransferase